MADPPPVTPAPSLLTMTRLANGSFKYTWDNNATSHTSYLKIYAYFRRVGTGTWSQGNSFGYPTISNQQAIQYFIPGTNTPLPVNENWEMCLAAASAKGGLSVKSNTKSVNGETTPSPVLTSVTRINAGNATAIFEPRSSNAAITTKCYVWLRKEGTSRFTQVNATTSAGQTMIDIPNLEGNTDYEVELTAGGPGKTSVPSSRKSIEAWWETPPGVDDLAGAWVGDQINLSWTTKATVRGSYTSQEVWRAEGTLGQLNRIATISGVSDKYFDKTADKAKLYRYQVIPRSPKGLATQRPTITVGAALLVPNAATSVKSVYVATDKALITWTVNATVERPNTSQKIMRRDVGSSTPILVATVSGSAVHQEVTLGGNKYTEFWIDSINSAGTTSSNVTTPPIATTPARPGSLSAAWTGPDQITLTWPKVSSNGDGFNIEFSTDNVTFYPAPVEGTLGINETSWVHKEVNPTVPHYYQLNVHKDSVATAPVSSWVKSAVVNALTKPNKPTTYVPEVIDATEAIKLRHLHNSVDGSAQTKANIQYHKQGAGWTSVDLFTDSDFITIPAGTFVNGDVIEYKVKTAGITGEWSDFSDVRVFTLRPRPVVLSLTTSSLSSSTVSAIWTSSAQTSAIVELLNTPGATLQAVTTGAATRQTPFEGLTDEVTYKFRVVIRDQWQSSLPVVVDFTPDLVGPGKPTGTATFQPSTGSVLLSATPGTGTTKLEVLRNGKEIGWMQSNSFLDEYVPLGKNPIYTLRAYSSTLGLTNSDPITVNTSRGKDVFLHFDGRIIKGGWNARNNGKAGRHLVKHTYVGGKASFTYGDVKSRVLNVTLTLDTRLGDAPLEDWIEASEHAAIVYRDPAGRVMRGAMTDFDFEDSRSEEQVVSFTIEEGE